MKKLGIILILSFACIHPFNWHKRIFPKLNLYAYATTVNFQWTASTGAVAGYKLYQGIASGTYTSNVQIPGTGTTGSMDMDPALSRYVAATAYDAGNRESAYSNEILCHPVITSTNTGGTITPGGTFFIQDGKPQAFNVTSAQRYQIKTVKVNGSTITVGSGTPTFTLSSVQARSVIAVEFEAIPIPGPPGMLQLLQSMASSLERIARVMDPGGIQTTMVIE